MFKETSRGLKGRLEARRHDGALDSGDVVQVVLLIVGFVMIAMVLLIWIGTATLNKGADTANCTEFAGPRYDNEAEMKAWRPHVCGSKDAGHSKEITVGYNGGIGKGNGGFKKDSTYTNRY